MPQSPAENQIAKHAQLRNDLNTSADPASLDKAIAEAYKDAAINESQHLDLIKRCLEKQIPIRESLYYLLVESTSIKYVYIGTVLEAVSTTPRFDFVANFDFLEDCDDEVQEFLETFFAERNPDLMYFKHLTFEGFKNQARDLAHSVLKTIAAPFKKTPSPLSQALTEQNKEKIKRLLTDPNLVVNEDEIPGLYQQLENNQDAGYVWLLVRALNVDIKKYLYDTFAFTTAEAKYKKFKDFFARNDCAINIKTYTMIFNLEVEMASLQRSPPDKNYIKPLFQKAINSEAAISFDSIFAIGASSRESVTYFTHACLYDCFDVAQQLLQTFEVYKDKNLRNVFNTSHINILLRGLDLLINASTTQNAHMVELINNKIIEKVEQNAALAAFILEKVCNIPLTIFEPVLTRFLQLDLGLKGFALSFKKFYKDNPAQFHALFPSKDCVIDDTFLESHIRLLIECKHQALIEAFLQKFDLSYPVTVADFKDYDLTELQHLLYTAIKIGRKSTVELLLQVPQLKLNAYYQGYTPYTFALQLGQYEIAFLIQPQQNKQKPAIIRKFESVMRPLTSNESIDDQGNSHLHYYARTKTTDRFKNITADDDRLYQRNKAKETPLLILLQRHDDSNTKLVLEKMRDEKRFLKSLGDNNTYETKLAQLAYEIRSTNSVPFDALFKAKPAAVAQMISRSDAVLEAELSSLGEQQRQFFHDVITGQIKREEDLIERLRVIQFKIPTTPCGVSVLMLALSRSCDDSVIKGLMKAEIAQASKKLPPRKVRFDSIKNVKLPLFQRIYAELEKELPVPSIADLTEISCDEVYLPSALKFYLRYLPDEVIKECCESHRFCAALTSILDDTELQEIILQRKDAVATDTFIKLLLDSNQRTFVTKLYTFQEYWNRYLGSNFYEQNPIADAQIEKIEPHLAAFNCYIKDSQDPQNTIQILEHFKDGHKEFFIYTSRVLVRLINRNDELAQYILNRVAKLPEKSNLQLEYLLRAIHLKSECTDATILSLLKLVKPRDLIVKLNNSETYKLEFDDFYRLCKLAIDNKNSAFFSFLLTNFPFFIIRKQKEGKSIYDLCQEVSDPDLRTQLGISCLDYMRNNVSMIEDLLPAFRQDLTPEITVETIEEIFSKYKKDTNGLCIYLIKVFILQLKQNPVMAEELIKQYLLFEAIESPDQNFAQKLSAFLKKLIDLTPSELQTALVYIKKHTISSSFKYLCTYPDQLQASVDKRKELNYFLNNLLESKLASLLNDPYYLLAIVQFADVSALRRVFSIIHAIQDDTFQTILKDENILDKLLHRIELCLSKIHVYGNEASIHEIQVLFTGVSDLLQLGCEVQDSSNFSCIDPSKINASNINNLAIYSTELINAKLIDALDRACESSEQNIHTTLAGDRTPLYKRAAALENYDNVRKLVMRTKPPSFLQGLKSLAQKPDPILFAELERACANKDYEYAAHLLALRVDPNVNNGKLLLSVLQQEYVPEDILLLLLLKNTKLNSAHLNYLVSNQQTEKLTLLISNAVRAAKENILHPLEKLVSSTDPFIQDALEKFRVAAAKQPDVTATVTPIDDPVAADFKSKDRDDDASSVGSTRGIRPVQSLFNEEAADPEQTGDPLAGSDILKVPAIMTDPLLGTTWLPDEPASSPKVLDTATLDANPRTQDPFSSPDHEAKPRLDKVQTEATRSLLFGAEETSSLFEDEPKPTAVLVNAFTSTKSDQQILADPLFQQIDPAAETDLVSPGRPISLFAIACMQGRVQLVQYYLAAHSERKLYNPGTTFKPFIITAGSLIKAHKNATKDNDQTVANLKQVLDILLAHCFNAVAKPDNQTLEEYLTQIMNLTAQNRNVLNNLQTVYPQIFCTSQPASGEEESSSSSEREDSDASNSQSSSNSSRSYASPLPIVQPISDEEILRANPTVYVGGIFDPLEETWFASRNSPEDDERRTLSTDTESLFIADEHVDTPTPLSSPSKLEKPLLDKSPESFAFLFGDDEPSHPSVFEEEGEPEAATLPLPETTENEPPNLAAPAFPAAQPVITPPAVTVQVLPETTTPSPVDKTQAAVRLAAPAAVPTAQPVTPSLETPAVPTAQPVTPPLETPAVPTAKAEAPQLKTPAVPAAKPGAPANKEKEQPVEVISPPAATISTFVPVAPEATTQSSVNKAQVPASVPTVPTTPSTPVMSKAGKKAKSAKSHRHDISKLPASAAPPVVAQEEKSRVAQVPTENIETAPAMQPRPVAKLTKKFRRPFASTKEPLAAIRTKNNHNIVTALNALSTNVEKSENDYKEDRKRILAHFDDPEAAQYLILYLEKNRFKADLQQTKNIDQLLLHKKLLALSLDTMIWYCKILLDRENNPGFNVEMTNDHHLRDFVTNIITACEEDRKKLDDHVTQIDIPLHQACPNLHRIIDLSPRNTFQEIAHDTKNKLRSILYTIFRIFNIEYKPAEEYLVKPMQKSMTLTCHSYALSHNDRTMKNLDQLEVITGPKRKVVSSVAQAPVRAPTPKASPDGEFKKQNDALLGAKFALQGLETRASNVVHLKDQANKAEYSQVLSDIDQARAEQLTKAQAAYRKICNLAKNNPTLQQRLAAATIEEQQVKSISQNIFNLLNPPRPAVILPPEKPRPVEFLRA